MSNRSRVRHKEDSFRSSGMPEQNVLCAVIARAAGDMISSDPAIRKKACKWIQSQDTSEGSFCRMVETLRLTRSAESLRYLANLICQSGADTEALIADLQVLFSDKGKDRSVLSTLQKLRQLAARRAG